jgi:hypothetical protein
MPTPRSEERAIEEIEGAERKAVIDTTNPRRESVCSAPVRGATLRVRKKMLPIPWMLAQHNGNE